MVPNFLVENFHNFCKLHGYYENNYLHIFDLVNR